MSAVRWDILASPRMDENGFVTVGTDLRLFDVITKDDSTPPPRGMNVMQISAEKFAVRASVNTEVTLPKCVAWNPAVNSDSKHLMAVGQQNGKVTLTSFRTAGRSEHVLDSCEFNPKQSRPCLALQWSSDYPNLLAEGLDKVKNEPSLMVWDTNLFSGTEVKHVVSSDTIREGPVCVSRAQAEFGMPGEPTLSLDWLSNKCLVCSSRQQLRVYDLREEGSKRSQLESLTKAVFGVTVDPHNEHRIASFFEGTVHIYDTRHFEKPMVTIERPNTFSKLAWCPTRFSCLGALVKDSSIVRLFDVQQNEFDLMAVEDDLPPPVLERTIRCEAKHVHSFSWMKSHSNCFVVIGSQGEVSEIVVHERIPLAWAADNQLSWSSGSDLICSHCQVDGSVATADIAEQMRHRAIQGYGLDVAKNLAIVKGNPALRGLWNWMDHMTKLRHQGKLKPLIGRPHSNFPGVHAVVTHTTSGHETCSPLSEDMPHILHHESAERKRAMLLCGWNFDERDSTLDDFVMRLELQNDFERAATISLLHGQIRRAVYTLLNGASALREDKAKSSTLSLVSMALSGYADNKSLWHDICRRHKEEIQNPYLVAAFAFLTSGGENFQSVLQPRNGPGLKINDSVASACMFLEKTHLDAHLDKVTSVMTEQGSLDGILLTGLSKAGLDLLQKYVEKTGDVQTACLVGCYAGDTQLTSDSRFTAWLESYACLLDVWQLWKERAEFDVERQLLVPCAKPCQQVFVTCKYCGKSVSTETGGASDSHRARPSVMPQSAMASGQTKPRITSCPGCRQPLPRCSICLLNMGTASSPVRLHPSSGGQQSESAKRASFDSWFTWCQTCKHGGHAGHVVQWFRDHTECAVTSCSCRCMSLDSTTGQGLNMSLSQ